jgi:hypothetical protein
VGHIAWVVAKVWVRNCLSGIRHESGERGGVRGRRNVTVNDPTPDLEVVLENIARIERFVAGCDEDSFRNNEQVVFAVQYASLLMRAAVDRLGDAGFGVMLRGPRPDRDRAVSPLR